MSFASCNRPEDTAKVDKYEAYLNDDMGLVTEQGVMIFIPRKAMVKKGKPYTGKVWIDIANLDSIHNKITSTSKEVIHKIQNPGNIFSFKSTKNGLKDIDIRAGSTMFVILPLTVADTTRYYPLDDPSTIIEKGFPKGFLSIETLEKSFPKNISNVQLELIALNNETAKKRRKASLLLVQQKESFRNFESFLNANWELAQRNYKAYYKIKENDLGKDIAFFATSINYLGGMSNSNSSLYNIFANNIDAWQESLVVIDWTGSMYGFEDQLLKILEDFSEQKILKYLALFNDKYYYENRTIGNFEGVFIETDTFPSIRQAKDLIYRCQTEGFGGGDLSENDLEAVVKSIATIKKENFKNLILICDNNAKPKDMPLLSKINIPINIIACRASTIEEVLPEYKSIAKHKDACLIIESGQEDCELELEI